MSAEKRAPTRTHVLAIKVVFDKPVTHEAARLAARDCIHGSFYPTSFNDCDAELMTVRGFPRVKGASATEKP